MYRVSVPPNKQYFGGCNGCHYEQNSLWHLLPAIASHLRCDGIGLHGLLFLHQERVAFQQSKKCGRFPSPGKSRNRKVVSLPSSENSLTFAFYSPTVRAVEETGNGWRTGSIADQ